MYIKGENHIITEKKV